MRRVPVLAVLALLLFFRVGAAQAPPGQRAGGPPAPAQPSAWLHPTGPYTVVMEEDPTFSNHTVYRPESLAPFPGRDRLPIVAFSGPGCDFNGTAFRPFFTEVASHGFLVVVNGPPEPKGGSGPGFPRTTSADHLASVEWAVRENARKESAYYQRLDTSKIAVMGQSCGGLQTLDISQDPRITTVVLWNSGVLNTSAGAPAMPVRTTTNKEVLKTLRVPIAYFVGKTDMANPNAADDFQRIDGVPVFLGSLDIPGDAHAGTFRQTNGGKFGVAGVAWLKWQLKGDQGAARMFVGDQCGLCQDSSWEIRKKRIDQFPAAADVPHKEIRLYEGKAPGSENWSQPESVTDTRYGKVVANVSEPSYTVYQADPAIANGAAMVVCPGGGFRTLSWAEEGTKVAEWLNSKGISAFVLKYRTLQGGPPPAGGTAPQMSPAPRKEIEIRNANANPAPANKELNAVIQMAIADGREAIHSIRRRAAEWHVDPTRIGIIGFSAGGGVAIGAALAEKSDAYPDFVVSVYGPSQVDVNVPAHAGPLFIAVGASHFNVASGCVALFSAWKAAGKPVELHVYDGVSGAFGMTRRGLPVDTWTDRLHDWLQARKLVTGA